MKYEAGKGDRVDEFGNIFADNPKVVEIPLDELGDLAPKSFRDLVGATSIDFTEAMDLEGMSEKEFLQAVYK